MSLTFENNTVTFHYDNQTLTVTPWGKNAFRVKCWLQKQNLTHNWALLEQENIECSYTKTDKLLTVTNGKITVQLEPFNNKVLLSFKNQKGELLLSEFKTTGYMNTHGKEFIANAVGDWHVKARFKSNPKERIYGMGQYQQENYDLKGCDIELAHRNSQESIPFYISSLGYGFLWNNPAIGHAFFGKNLTTWDIPNTTFIDYVVIAGDTPTEIEHNYANITGKVPMMPDFAMGFWQSKCRYRTQDELLNVVREYKRRNLPIDVIVIDYFHWVLQGDWDFDPKYWYDIEGMCKELKELGVEPMVSFWQTLDKRCKRYKEAEEKGYIMQMDRGDRVSISCMSDTVYYDAFNEEARKYVWDILKKNYYDKGIHHFWLDQAECDCPRYDFDIYRFQEGPANQIINYYPMEHIKGLYEGLTSVGQQNPVILIRSGWCGAQRYGALLWSGDIISNFESLRRQVCAGLHTAIAGFPWWTTDIGGFYGAYVDDPTFRELMKRWVAFGAFSPVMRMHGVRNPQTPTMEGDVNVFGSGADNEIWSFGKEVYEVCKKYVLLRKAMLPYIRETMKKAHEYGEPVMKPMFYAFPNQDNLYNVEEQYMFGHDMLVAPVGYENMTERKVVLPSGLNWTYAWTGQLFTGGQTVTVDTPLDIIPVFIKEGSDATKYFK